VNITGGGLLFVSPNCTLRGAGPGRGLSTGINPIAPGTDSAGTFIPDPTATQIIKADRATQTLFGLGASHHRLTQKVLPAALPSSTAAIIEDHRAASPAVMHYLRLNSKPSVSIEMIPRRRQSSEANRSTSLRSNAVRAS
jgi:hypothetical protein